MTSTRIEQRQARARLATWLFVLFLPLQLLAMHWPAQRFPVRVPHIWDKLPHFAVYAAFASLLVWFIVAQRRARGASNLQGLARRLLTVFICVAAYAWIDELTQPWTGRECDVYDWLADILGAGTVLVAAYAWRRFRNAEVTPVAAADWSAS